MILKDFHKHMFVLLLQIAVVWQCCLRLSFVILITFTLQNVESKALLEQQKTITKYSYFR